MNGDYPITFRLPKKLHAPAEDYLIESGEKNLNTLAQKLLVSELERRRLKSENSISKFDDENVQFLLAAVGNTRELILRVFEILFAGADAKKQFEHALEDLQIDWSAINQVYTRRTSAPDSGFDVFAAGVSTDVDEIFPTKLIEPVPESFAPGALVDAENRLAETLKQASLFD